jgi:predicted nucleic acid-binding protein
MTITYIDSNVWIYFFDSETPEHAAAEKATRGILQTDELILNTITAVEVAHYLARRLSGPELKTRMSALMRLVETEIVGFDDILLRETIDLLSQYTARYGLGGRDAAILATMTAYKVDRIVTQDKALKRVAVDLGFSVVDPLAG